MRILISAGEVSGDAAGARLARELRSQATDVVLTGLGGPRMAEAGVAVLANTNPAGTVGIIEVARAVPTLVRAARALSSHVREQRPDAAVLIGNDVFNLLVARRLRHMGVPTSWWFPPQVWVWRSIAKVFARSVDSMLTVFHEESHVYRAAHADLQVDFVGHYLADELAPRTPDDVVSARQSLDLPLDRPVIGLLPGSRGHELAYMLDIFLDGAMRLSMRSPSPCFVLPLSEPAHRSRIEAAVARRPGLDVRLVTGGPAAMRASDVILVSSGTATLEATILNVPMVVAYRMARLTNTVINISIRLGLIASRTVALPNLLTGTRVVPELLQEQLTGSSLAAHVGRLLDDPAAARAMSARLSAVGAQVHGGQSVARAASLVLASAGVRASLAEAV